MDGLPVATGAPIAAGAAAVPSALANLIKPIRQTNVIISIFFMLFLISQLRPLSYMHRGHLNFSHTISFAKPDYEPSSGQA